MGNAKETGRFLGNFIRHPCQTLKNLDWQFKRMMALIFMGGSACETGMQLPTTEINPEEEKKEGKIVE